MKNLLIGFVIGLFIAILAISTLNRIAPSFFMETCGVKECVTLAKIYRFIIPN